MKISDLLDYVDEIMHNVFSVKTKLRWINQLEAEVQTEVLLLTAEGITQYTEDDFSAELLVPAPHDQIYQNYLMWQIALAQGEDRANNLAEQFNRVWYAYLRFAKETINPGAGIADKVRYYLTAYQIAVKLGYTGTETEWVKSLRGADGEPGAGLNIADQVATEADLPNGSGLEKGTGYLVGEDNEALLYIWNGTDWFYKQKLSGEGKQGEPGPAGDPGVYVSETEPTDPDAVVWINPAGEATPGGGGGGSVDLTGYAKKTWVTEQLKSYAKEEDIPTKTSQLTNDSGYLTEHQSLEGYATEDYVKAKIAEAELGGGEGGESIDLSGYALKSDLPTKTSQLTNDSGYLTAVPEGYAKTEDIPTKTSQLTNDSGYLTEHQSLAEYAKKEEIPTKLADLTEDETHRTVTDAEKETWNAKSDFSGNFDDLTNRPIMCNPNLLDNWYFANPVNQKGGTVHSGDNYTIDRWAASTYSQHTLQSGGILAGKTGGSIGTTTFKQKIEAERAKLFAGQKITLSFMVDANNITGSTCWAGIYKSMADNSNRSNMGGADLPMQKDSKNIGLYIHTITLSDDIANYEIIEPVCNIPTGCVVIAAKLEISDTQTLAHQDTDGNWVLNEIPDYGEQLARCQRYFKTFRGTYTGGFITFGYGTSNADGSLAYIFLENKMRAQPAIVTKGNMLVKCGSGTYTVTRIESGANHSDAFYRAQVTVDGTLPVYEFATIQANDDATADIWLDANL